MSTVVNKPYSTEGNGGRKLVRLSNGWLVAATYHTDGTTHLFKSTNNGATWEERSVVNSYGSVQSIAMVAIPNTTKIAFLIAYQNIMVKHEVYDVTNWTLAPNTTVDSAQSAISGVSLAIDPTNGHLHAAWASKNATNSLAFNIRYAKSTDGGVTWSAVTQVTSYNLSGRYHQNPSIVVAKDGLPVMLMEMWDGTYYHIIAYTFRDGQWRESTRVHFGNSFVQARVSVVADKTGMLHVTWENLEIGGTYRTISYSNSVDGITWSSALIVHKSVGQNNLGPSITVDDANKLSIVYHRGDAILHQATSIDRGASWSINAAVGNGSNPSTLYDPTFTVKFGDVVPVIYQTGTGVNYTGTYTANNEPTVTLTSPSANQTLYENDTINIAGTAFDADKDQSVTAYYQINNEPRKVLATNLSQTQIALSKQLTFKGGKIYDSDTAITGNLADGVAHTLKVWAEDSEKASSIIAERAFYVVPNRAPLLSVDAVVPSGIVDTDKFKISGTASDQDANANVTVTRRTNTGNSVEIYNGPGGAWEFDVSLSHLVVGQNTIIVEAIDNYGAKTSKTIKLNKNEVKTPILQSVARYKIEPPKGSAKGVLLWIQRDEDLALKVELSMTLQGEQESYETLTATNTAPVDSLTIEDEFYFEAAEAKNNIILKLSTSRIDVNINHKIHLISGVLE